MNYSQDEKLEFSAYNTTLTFPDTNIVDLLNKDEFELHIRDMYSNESIIITSKNFNEYGYTSENPDTEKRESESLYNNGGILVTHNGSNVLYIKQLIACQYNDKNIGFNSSHIDIWLNYEHIGFNSVILPKLIRNNEIVQVSDDEDPVLSAVNLRPGFDFEKENINSAISKNYTMGANDEMYVNTDMGVPCYVSTVSAFISTENNTNVDIDETSIKSYIFNNETSDSDTITYDMDGPFIYQPDLPDGLNTSIKYYTFNQYISAAENKLYKNKLILNMQTKEIS